MKRNIAAAARDSWVTRSIARSAAEAHKQLAAKNYAQAIRYARSVLVRKTDHADAAGVLIYAHHALGKHAKARAILKSFPNVAARSQSLRFQMAAATVYEHQGRLSDAWSAYTRATKLKPDLLLAWNRLGIVQLKKRRELLAIASFETALTLDRDSVIVLTNLGSAYRRRAASRTRDKKSSELLKRAEKSYRAAIALQASYAPAYFNLALLFFQAGEFPGMTLVERLRQAELYFRQYKRLGNSTKQLDGHIDHYLTAAQKAYKVATTAAELARQRKKKAAQPNKPKKPAASGRKSGRNK